MNTTDCVNSRGCERCNEQGGDKNVGCYAPPKPPKARQILFNTEMVNAILGGRKTQTRRPVKPQPHQHHWEILRGYKRDIRLMDTSGGLYAKFTYSISRGTIKDRESVWAKSPFGKPGDLLYVREKFCVGAVVCAEGNEWFIEQGEGQNNTIPYEVAISEDFGIEGVIWKPSIFMLRKDSRLTLKVKRVWVERVQNIDELRALNEGIKELSNCSPPNYSKTEKQYMGGDCVGFKTAKDAFSYLWDSIYNQQKDIRKNFPWESNPWVWACEFSVIKKNVDEILK
ncbi:MAG: hypothetical protein KAJ18_11585 [Candidatus Omnitrophica bacterium]|nr:hypothetical protein [Candidatus Omnitrophota bacterium]